MRLIDADALAKDIEEYQKSMVFHSYGERMHFDDMIDFAIDHIEEAPTIEAAPVVHARWIEDGYRGIPCVCSHCGEEAHYTSTFQEKFDYDWDEKLVSCGYEEIREYIRSKCCPECGARMDEMCEEKS